MIESRTKIPSREEMVRRWERYAREIAEASSRSGDIAARSNFGELTIMGSGMGGSDLLSDVREALLSADMVFYCLADAVTQILIQRIRPDAFDMTVLYDSVYSRYDTYMQMAEAMLHPVREGKSVLAIYYGHPGVFAMPTHRAMKIARKEGYRARMRPGVSALDYLIADVGFDPAYPGLVSYEASDMLLRQRKMDPSLHVILWQVGVIGEFGFSRSGFRNDGLDLLLEAIESEYGPDWRITHYIASRFPGVDPIIDQFTPHELRLTENRSKIIALSTFYIPPMRAVQNDYKVSVEMKVIASGAPLPPAVSQYDVTLYGENEQAALLRLSDFSVPDHYNYIVETPGIDAMIQIHTDLNLQSEYRRDPRSAITAERFPDSSSDARDKLISRHIRSVQQAINEKRVPS